MTRMRSCDRWIRIGLLLLCTCLLSSCAKGNANITVHWNGTADLNVDLSVNNEMLAMEGMSDVMDRISEQLQERNMAVKPYVKEGRIGFTVFRTFDLHDMSHLSLPNGVTIKRFEEKEFLYTNTKMIVTVDMEQLVSDKVYNAGITDHSIMAPFVKSLLQRQVDFKVLLTAPFEAGTNNADEIRDHGRTLVWNMKLFEPNQFEISFAIPNIVSISYLAGVLIVILLLLWLGNRMIRKRRRVA